MSENRVHDDFIWIELAGFLPDGKMIRDQFVRIDDVEAISSWRDKFNNTDVFSSICRYEKPYHEKTLLVLLIICLLLMRFLVVSITG